MYKVSNNNNFCQAIKCNVKIDYKFLMCRNHWSQVPISIKNDVMKECAGKTDQQRFKHVPYLLACAEAVEFIAAKENNPNNNTYRRLINILSKVKQEA